MDWLPWAPLVAASLHISEEFLVPGGFQAWYRRYRAEPSKITPRFLVIVNGALLATCCNAALLGRTPLGIAYWLAISALLCSNGCWHVWASYKSHTYSPGVVTGLAVYLPLAAYGYSQFVRSGAIPIGVAVVAYIVGASYPLWSAAYHRRRQNSTPRRGMAN
jgi:membrane protein implicated in regulation of membrane protease activity